ncbi:MAG TPA: beta-propeller fold lactonase family protein [Steroidobacteraceae bacterium]
MKIQNVLKLSAAGLALAGCRIGDGAQYTVGGIVTGVAGAGLVLEDNSGSDLAVGLNGGFVFGNRLGNGDVYSVTVKSQPANPAQTCTVRSGSGTIDKADVTNVLVSCTQTGRFAYVANRQSNNLSAYAIDSANGGLLPIAGSPFASTGTTPTAVAVDPNGDFLYVANDASNNVSVYSVDTSSGALTAVGFPANAGTSPGALAVDPRDQYLYVANLSSNDVSAYTIVNGVLSEIPGSPFAVGAEPAALQFDPNGNFLYVANFNGATMAVFALDQATGALSTVSGSPFVTGSGPISIAIDPTNTFAFVANEAAATLSEFALNPETGALAPVAGSPIAVTTGPEFLAIDPQGRYLYAANVTSANQVASFSITPASGSLMPLSTAAAGALPISLTVDPSGAFVYAANYNSNDISAYMVDEATGALIPVPGSPFAAGTQPHSIAID